MATDTINTTNSREAKFLASQQARLSRLHEQGQSDENDILNIQYQRKEFWKIFKQECSSLHLKLSALAGKRDENEGDCADDVDDSKENSDANDTMYITAARRNEALDRLQNINFSIRALHHYALHHSTGHSDSNDNHNKMFLPQQFVDNPMPELPMADLRLLNTEVQLLKNKAYNVQSIIIPKEKFRFKRYHKMMQEKKLLDAGLRPGIPLYDGSDDMIDNLVGKEDDENTASNMDIDASDTKSTAALTSFDGLTLSNQKSRKIEVETNGNFVMLDLGTTGENVTVTQNNDVSREAKAFLIQDIDGCQVEINGMYNSVHLIDTKNTTIKIQSPVHGPVHVTNCIDTKILIPFSRQLRIHDCTDVSFIIHVASGPIIEGCKGMKFYQKDYSSSDRVSADESSFDAGKNFYAEVKDFHWLKNNVKSPNFDVYTEDTSRMVEELSTFFRTAVVTDEESEVHPTIQSDAAVGHDDSDGESSEDEL